MVQDCQIRLAIPVEVSGSDVAWRAEGREPAKARTAYTCFNTFDMFISSSRFYGESFEGF